MPKGTANFDTAQAFSARCHDEAVGLYESAFPGRVMISKNELARFYACSMSTVNRILKRNPSCYVVTPGGVRIKRNYVINWMIGGE